MTATPKLKGPGVLLLQSRCIPGGWDCGKLSERMDRVLRTQAPEFWQLFAHYAVRVGRANVLIHLCDPEGIVTTAQAWGPLPPVVTVKRRARKGAVLWPGLTIAEERDLREMTASIARKRRGKGTRK